LVICEISKDGDCKKQKWQFSTTPLSFDGPYPANRHEYRHNPHIFTKYSLFATFPPLIVWVYLIQVLVMASERQALRRMLQGELLPFKVIDFGTNRKRVYIFLFVVNSYLDPILHRFRDMAA